MKKFSTILLFLCIAFSVLLTRSSIAQQNLDSLQHQLHNVKNDTFKIRVLSDLAWYYSNIRIDSSLFYARQVIDLSERKNYSYGKFLGSCDMTQALNAVGDYPHALGIA